MKNQVPAKEVHIRDANSLPATFTTGYKRDLATAREIIRKRLENSRCEEIEHSERLRLSA
ncbi:MAG: hypothetical protein ACR2QX_10290 [Woeseiaceae bacterium]